MIPVMEMGDIGKIQCQIEIIVAKRVKGTVKIVSRICCNTAPELEGHLLTVSG